MKYYFWVKIELNEKQEHDFCLKDSDGLIYYQWSGMGQGWIASEGVFPAGNIWNPQAIQVEPGCQLERTGIKLTGHKLIRMVSS